MILPVVYLKGGMAVRADGSPTRSVLAIEQNPLLLKAYASSSCSYCGRAFTYYALQFHSNSFFVCK